MFYNTISDAFAQKTKLKVLKRDGDLQLAGEIVEYSQTNKSISSDGFSAQVQLKIAVNVRFTNNQNHEEDFEQRFSATAEYDSVKGHNVLSAGRPESFNVLMKEMQSLGLDIRTVREDGEER